MPITDMPLLELKSYRPPLTKTDDFDTFWRESVGEAEEQPLVARSREVEYFTKKKIRVEEVTFDGFLDKSPIVGYFISSTEADIQRPTLVQYHGYSGNKGHPTDYLGWVLLGFSVFAVDIRGQGGQSPDHARYEPGNRNGNMMKGIGDKSGYYFRLVYMDCYRAVNYALGRQDVDAKRVGVMGSSQGGGLSITTGALHKKVGLLMSGVPYLCNFERGVNVATLGPYLEVLDYLREHPDREEMVMRTLSYFDAMNLAPLVSAPTLISAGLIDALCPPSTVFATYHHIGANDKELAFYPGTGHEDTSFHLEKKMKWATSRLMP